MNNKPITDFEKILFALRKTKDKKANREARRCLHIIKDEMAATKKRMWDLGMELDAIEETIVPMRIGIDIHGVIDTKPKFFSKFSIRLRSRGHLV
jgi:hypothetical protein